MRFVLSIALLLGASQAAAQPYAYIPNYSSNDVSVIDDATKTVVATIPVGSQPWGVSVSPDSTLVYVANNNGGSLSVIDTSLSSVIATVPVGGNPFGVTFSPDGSLVYSASFSSNTVNAIDTTTHTIVDSLVVGFSPYSIAVTPDGAKLYVTNYNANTVSVLDAATLSLITTIPAGNGPLQLAMAPDGATVVVANGYSNNLLVISTATDAVVSTIPVALRAVGVAVSNDGSLAVVTSDNGNDVFVVDLDTAAVIATLPIGNTTWGVDFTPDGSQFYVSVMNAGTVRTFDATTFAALPSVAVGSSPFAHGNFFAATGFIAPIAQGVELDAVPGVPLVYAEEINATPGAPVSLLNPAGALNLSSQLGYSFSAGEVRYARFECGNGLRFSAGSTAVYDGPGNASLGAINGLGGSFMSFSVTAIDNTVVASDRLVITGDRQITGTQDVSCTYGLYDFPSQAATGGATGRVYTVTGPYLRFASSYALDVEIEGNPVADVESADPAYSEFTNATPTNDVELGRIGRFNYGEVQDVTGAVQPRSPAGPQVTLVDLMGANTALLFAGDFSAASDVFFSSAADCTVNVQSADDFNQFEAVFTIGSNAALAHQLCFATDGVAIPVSNYTVALDAVAASPAWVVTDLAPQALGEITRNGTELQAPLAQVPAGYLSRMVLTNTGSQARTYAIEVLGETGNVISSSNLTGTVAANATLVVDLGTVLTGFTAAPRATLNVTIAAPNNTIQGLYQIVNPNSGTLSNHVMVRPGKN